MNIYEKLFGKEENASESSFGLESFLMRDEKHKEAKKRLEKPMNLMKRSRFEEAESMLREIIEDTPTFMDAYLALGLLYEMTHKDLEAEEQYVEAIEFDDNTQPIAHIFLGSLLSKQKYRSAQAEAQFREAIKIDPWSVDGHTKLGSLLSETGRFAEAEAELRKAIQIDKNVSSPHYFLGATLCDLEREDEALSELEIAQELFKKEHKKEMADKLKPLIAELRSRIEKRKKLRLQQKSSTEKTRTNDFVADNPWRAKEVLIQLFDICASRTMSPDEKKWQFDAIVDENRSLIFGTPDFLELLETEIEIAEQCEPINALPYMEVRWKLTHKDSHYKEMFLYAQKIKRMDNDDLYGFKRRY